MPTVGYWDGNRYHRSVGPDLQKATRYAQKAKTVYTGFAVEANRYLSWIALEHINHGEMDAARALVTGDLGHGTGANFLDADTCESIAIVHSEDDQHRSAGDFFARAFCLGRINSALLSAIDFFKAEEYSLCKLWLGVACKAKHDFTPFIPFGESEAKEWPAFQRQRDEMKSKLREIRNTCGGCGAALEGDTRQYCRGCWAYCYCSRECQKLHWNRKKDSHRDECKETQDHARRVLSGGHQGWQHSTV